MFYFKCQIIWKYEISWYFKNKYWTYIMMCVHWYISMNPGANYAENVVIYLHFFSKSIICALHIYKLYLIGRIKIAFMVPSKWHRKQFWFWTKTYVYFLLLKKTCQKSKCLYEINILFQIKNIFIISFHFNNIFLHGIWVVQFSQYIIQELIL